MTMKATKGVEFELVDGVDDDGDQKLYVAVSKEVKACRSILLWALHNSGGKRVCLLHVHRPAQTIPILGGRFPISSFSKQAISAHWDKERQEMCKILDEYLHICANAGVEAEKLYIETDSVEKGIVELISQHKIECLAMGAAADNRYSRKMMEPKSKKANYVLQHAPSFCQTWFICKGHLIYTRERAKQSHLNDGTENELKNPKPRLTETASGSGRSSPHSHRRADCEGSFDECGRASTFSLSRLSGNFSHSTTTLSTLFRLSVAEERQPEEKQCPSSSSNSLEASLSDAHCDRFERATLEAEAAKRVAFEESMKRREAVKEAIDAIHMAIEVENLYYKEVRMRIEIEEQLAKAKEELTRTKRERDMALQELRATKDQKLLLERRAEESEAIGKDLEERIMFALESLQSYTKL